MKILFLLILVIQILGSIENRESILRRSKKTYVITHFGVLPHYETKLVILPESPLHLSGNIYANVDYTVLITDTTINLIRRSDNWYYKCVLTYKSVVNDDVIVLSNIEIDETSSIFLFSTSNDLGDCVVELGEEYSYEYKSYLILYRELKEKCTNGVKEIEDAIKCIKSSKKISSCEERFVDGIKSIVCHLSISDNTTPLYQDHEINYKLNNLKIGSFSPSTEFSGSFTGEFIKVNNNNKLMIGSYGENLFSYISRKATVTNEGNYTKVVTGLSSDEVVYYYLCLESQCKYICENYRNFKEWDLYKYQCYSKGYDFDSDFNNHFNKFYNDAKNYNPNKNKIRRSLSKVEEEKNDVKQIKSTNGYYYEDVKEGRNGYYKGYFIVDNTLTIIEQTSQWNQENVEQLKLVLNLDSTTNINDVIVDKEKSGVESEYENGQSDKVCQSFIPLKENTKFKTCYININLLISDYMNKEFTVVVNEKDTKLIIHDINDDNNKNDKTISLTEYDSTKLNEIINKISKFTKPIPSGKCLSCDISENDNEITSTLYKQAFYNYQYEINDNKENKKVLLKITPKEDEFYYTNTFDYYLVSADDDSQYLLNNGKVFYHKFVDFKGNDYKECNEKLKNELLKNYEDKINQLKKEEGISDNTNNGILYSINIFIFTLVFIILL